MKQKNRFKNNRWLKNTIILLTLNTLFLTLSAQEKQGIYMPSSPTDSFIIVDPVPQFQGGVKAMYQFLAENINYSIDSTGINGKVYVAFMVNTDGSVSDIKIKKGLNQPLNEEVKRVIQLMSGKWTCGYQNGVPVRVAYVLPVSIRLE